MSDLISRQAVIEAVNGLQSAQPNTAVGYVPPLKRTNADRIRSMTDEELAEWISNGYYIPHCPTLDGCPDDIGTHDGCDSCWLKWLKAEVEE